MGEEAWRVHTVGFPAIDLICEGRFAKSLEVKERLVLDLARPIVLFTQHSITTEVAHTAVQLTPSLEAIRKLTSDGVQVIVTYPNNDAGGRKIIAELISLDEEKIVGVQVHRSLGRYLYHGVLALARDPAIRIACVGNSSSGVKETPAFGCPTVNIGSRQQGRLRAANVIDAGYDSNAIIEAVRRCLSDEEFRKTARTSPNPYFLGGAGLRIAEVLASIPINQTLLRKSMTLKGEVKDGWFS
jgi:UDP-N-acetylglucosamine 2-epimerase (non-hydrolysing)/GDP/UDP-N,N'-diacetylbacillosamine 2-epimerase (hydrolysing)